MLLFLSLNSINEKNNNNNDNINNNNNNDVKKFIFSNFLYD